MSVAASAQGPLPVQFPTDFSTHDYTSASYATTFREMWADVKTPGATMPGEGRTYSVGTIEIHEATESPSLSQFSFRDVELPPSPARPFIIQSGMTFQTKQVAILQVSGRDPDPQGYHGPNDDQDIRWQRFFYGDSDVLNNNRNPDPAQQGPMGRKATNARAISVFPVMNADGTQNHKETRIAICGETYDSELPGSQITQYFPTADYSANGFPQQSCRGWAKVHGKGALNVAYGWGLPSGFIAVYNGDGDFLWSHQFFFQEPDGFCAITDVSIRVEPRSENQAPSGLRDVVTYCGFSSFGVRPTIPNETSSLTPLNWFGTVVPNPNHATVPALGDTDHGLGQWDGIVGRISNVHVPEGGTPTTGDLTVREFHAIVGGIEQDALWGLAELPDNRFVVVGETANVSGTSATVTVGSQTVVRPTFPFTSSLDLSTTTDYCLGTVTVFDATSTLTGGDLVLESSAWLGNLERHTACRDVAVQLGARGGAVPAHSHRLAVVGTTDDDQLFSSSALQVPVSITPVLGFGPSATTNGFLATGFSVPWAPGDGLVFVEHGSFQGVAGQASWNGVANWNEYVDHLAVYGYEPGNAQDLALTSFLVDTAAPSLALTLVRRGVVPASPREESSKLGFMNAMPHGGIPAVFPALGIGSPAQFPGFPWQDFGLGEPSGGGGVAVDERGRVCVVGATDNSSILSVYPAIGAISPIARAHFGDWDGVRTVCDMLPLTVGRSDGSGEQNHSTGTIPPVPSGYTGSTTPTCALLPFGSLLGMAQAPLQRMLIDWEGPDPGPTPGYGTNPPPPAVHFLFIDRIPPTSLLLGAVVQFGVPTLPAGLSVGGIENWVSLGVPLPYLVVGLGPQSFRIPLQLPPATGVTFSAQVLVYLSSNLSAATFDPLVSPVGTAACSVAPWQVAATPAIVFSY